MNNFRNVSLAIFLLLFGCSVTAAEKIKYELQVHFGVNVELPRNESTLDFETKVAGEDFRCSKGKLSLDRPPQNVLFCTSLEGGHDNNTKVYKALFGDYEPGDKFILLMSNGKFLSIDYYAKYLGITRDRLSWLSYSENGTLLYLWRYDSYRWEG